MRRILTAATGLVLVTGVLVLAGTGIVRGRGVDDATSSSRVAISLGSAHTPGTASQQAFISQVAPGARAAQARYGIPAAVTIAQAIEESRWGHSPLAVRDHNLFAMKGTGPAGSEFRVYHNVAESITDHAKLLATSAAYHQAMASRHAPDAFANALTGVYAADPQYGANLIAIMRLYNLYQYDVTAAKRLTPRAGLRPLRSPPG
jgi:flagellum-specific peptidoglycan hydrolase FlgJ